MNKIKLNCPECDAEIIIGMQDDKIGILEHKAGSKKNISDDDNKKSNLKDFFTGGENGIITIGK